MLRNDYRDQRCSVASALEVIGERWTMLVIREVFYGRRKFAEMQKVLGIASNILSSRLGRLTDEGILERRIYSEKPERHEYFLTEKGLDLWPVIVSLMHWGDRHMPHPEGPPVRLVHRGECGGEIDDRRICTRCGERLEVRDARGILDPAVEREIAEKLAV